MNRRTILISGGAAAAWTAVSHAWAADADPPHEWLERWLAAFNDPDLRVYRRFIERYAPTLVPYLDDDLSLREVTGGFDLLSMETAGAGETAALVRDRAWGRRSKVVLTAAGPDKLDDIAFSGAPAVESEPRLTEAAVLAAVKRKLDTEGAAGRFSGALLVARGDHPLLSGARGFADAEGQTANTVATRFCVGSMGKLFTAVAVMQLVEQGRLALADPLARHLPDFANRALAEKVTLQHLLTHTGGTGDIFGSEYDAGQVKTVADAVRVFGAREPAFEPGARWGYSNFGFVLLGAIVERVSGRPYEAVFKAQIFDPAGMAATSQRFASDRPTASACTGARATGLKALAPYEGLPAGGGYSTVEDLHRFVVALRSGRLVTAPTLAAMTTPRVQAGTRSWGLGVAIGRRNGVPYWGHGGSAPGVNGDLAVYRNHAVVVLCNRGHPAATAAAEYIGARLPA